MFRGAIVPHRFFVMRISISENASISRLSAHASWRSSRPPMLKKHATRFELIHTYTKFHFWRNFVDYIEAID